MYELVKPMLRLVVPARYGMSPERLTPATFPFVSRCTIITTLPGLR